MIQSVIRYIYGYVKIRVEGFSPERFLNLCRHHQIYIWGLAPKDNAYEMYMSLKSFRKLRPIVKKTHTKIVLVKRGGLPFFLHKYRKRKLFFISFLLCIGLLYLYSTFIWDIHFEGNEKWTNETLLEFLETKNVSPYMPKREVDCNQIVKDIRRQYDDIVWVSASIDGSRLRIQIKENEDTFREEKSSGDKQEDNQKEGRTDTKEDVKPCDLVADKDGVITSIITRSGIPQVHVGDTVSKGDILVSGRIEVCNDAGEVTGYQYQKSDADILADTQMNYEDRISTTYRQKIYDSSKRRLYYVKIGSSTISAGILKHTYKEWEEHTEERQLKLGENFYLPISFGKKIIKPYVSKEKKYTKKQLQEKLSDNFSQFKKDLQENNIQIKNNNVKIYIDENSAFAKGDLLLNEKISKEADTEKLEVKEDAQGGE